jgi:Na+/H+ antiporter NhaD/arsenite permease-like protein
MTARSTGAGCPFFRRFLSLLRNHVLLVGAGAAAAAAVVSGRVPAERIGAVVDADLLLLLFALLLAVELVRESNFLDRAVAIAVGRFHGSRSFTLALMAATGVLAAVLTNDVALFVVIPFTVLARRFSDFRVRNAVVLEVLSANLSGCLTPLGNPQNLFLYHRAGWSPGRFVAEMIPFVVWSGAGLVVAVFWLEPPRSIQRVDAPMAPPDRGRALAGLACLGLVLAEIFRALPAWPAAVGGLVAGLFLLRRRWGQIDLSILPLFFFAFIVVEALRSFDIYALIRTLPGAGTGLRLYLAGLLCSQIISNVPATVLLTPLAAGRWRLLLYAVNAGGCGTLIASLANLLGLRIFEREHGRDRQFLRRLLALNAVFLLWSGAGGWILSR